jgi:AsmA protein
MSKTLKYGAIGAGALLLLLILAPFLIPADAYRVRIEQAALDTTGRALRINGPLQITLFPSPGVSAHNVTLANVPGGHAPYMATSTDLDVAVRFWPLLRGRIEVSEIVLNRPVINLERDSAGHGNWTFKSTQHGGSGGFSTRFSGIAINRGQVNYRDPSGKVRSAEQADISIGLVSIDKPVTLDGDVLYRGKRVSLEARIANLIPIGPGQTRHIELSFTSDLLQAGFKGSIAANGDLDGDLKLDTTNLRGVAEWLGEALPRNSGLKTVSLEGRIETTGNTIALPEAGLRLDGMSVTGRLTADLRGQRPLLGGDVVIDRLDINRYIENRQAASPSSANDGWNKQPIDLSALRRFDANLTIDTGVLHVRSLHLNKTHLTATLNNGLLNVALDPIALYGGTGKATLAVDVRGATPQFQNVIALDTVSMRALLNDSLNAQRLAGRGTLSLSVASQGNTADAVIRNLSGKGRLALANGQILGVDLGGVARLIRTALTGAVVNPGATTPFSALGGSFVIAHGVLATKDFHIESKEFRAAGTGTVDIGNRTLDFLVKPKAVLLPAGLGIGFPFRAYGPWRDVHYSANVAGAVTTLVGDVFHSALAVPGGALDFLTGKVEQKPKPQPAKSQPTKKKSFFDGLFGH